MVPFVNVLVMVSFYRSTTMEQYTESPRIAHKQHTKTDKQLHFISLDLLPVTSWQLVSSIGLLSSQGHIFPYINDCVIYMPSLCMLFLCSAWLRSCSWGHGRHMSLSLETVTPWLWSHYRTWLFSMHRQEGMYVGTNLCNTLLPILTIVMDT